MNTQPSPHFPVGFLIGLGIFYAALIGFSAWAYVRIVRKCGYSGWWVLMALVPIGNLVMLGLWAFQTWPIERELEYLRGYAAHTGLPGYSGPPTGYGNQPGSTSPAPSGS